MLIETAGGQPANAVARWDGSRWHSLGEGVGNLFRRATVWGIAASDIFVYVGGSFTNAGGVTVNNIACWNGRQWFPLGSGVEGNVLALAVRDRELYVAGVFESVGGRPSAHFGIWHEPLALWIAPVADDRVVISWSSASAGWDLEYSSTLAETLHEWTQIPPPYQTNASGCFVTEPSLLPSKFYRLRKP